MATPRRIVWIALLILVFGFGFVAVLGVFGIGPSPDCAGLDDTPGCGWFDRK